MGTNYYFKMPYYQIHIGKSSAGWCFALHVDPDNNISDLESWKTIFKHYHEGYIENEYGKRITIEEMLSMNEKHRKYCANADVRLGDATTTRRRR